MGISTNIKNLRKSAGYTQEQLADKVGVTRSTVTQWETGWSSPRMGMVEKLSDVFCVPKSAIVEDINSRYVIPEIAKIPAGARPAYAPLLGRVHAGDASEPDVLDDRIPLPYEVSIAHPSAYFLEVEGNCMNKVYPEGCFILVDPDKEPSSGSIAAVMIDGCDAIMRRILRTQSTIVLSAESFSDKYDDMIFTQDDMHTIELIGTVVWFQPTDELE